MKRIIKITTGIAASAGGLMASVGQASADLASCVRGCNTPGRNVELCEQQCRSTYNSSGSDSIGAAASGAGFFSNIDSLIVGALNFIMAIGALLVFVYLIWGGIDWITSGGDKGKTENARNKITAAIIGLIILAAAYAILSLVLAFLDKDLGTLLEVFN